MVTFKTKGGTIRECFVLSVPNRLSCESLNMYKRDSKVVPTDEINRGPRASWHTL